MEGKVESGESDEAGRKPVPLSRCLLLNVAQHPRVFPLLSPLGWSNSDPQSHCQPLLLPIHSSIPQETGMGPVKLTAGQCHVPWLHNSPPGPPKNPSQGTPSLPQEPGSL